MTVTGIVPLTRQKYQVEIDGQPAFVLYKGELSRYALKESGELSQEIYREIVDVVLTKRAKLFAMHLLEKMDRTEADLRRRLIRSGYPQEAVERAVAYVQSYGYINDREYARKYVMWKKQDKGRVRLRMELIQKGVSRDTVEEVLAEFSFSDAPGQMRVLVKKKRKGQGPLSEQEFRRLYGMLARRGYESGQILEVLREEGKEEE